MCTIIELSISKMCIFESTIIAIEIYSELFFAKVHNFKKPLTFEILAA